MKFTASITCLFALLILIRPSFAMGQKPEPAKTSTLNDQAAQKNPAQLTNEEWVSNYVFELHISSASGDWNGATNEYDFSRLDSELKNMFGFSKAAIDKYHKVCTLHDDLTSLGSSVEQLSRAFNPGYFAEDIPRDKVEQYKKDSERRLSEVKHKITLKETELKTTVGELRAILSDEQENSLASWIQNSRK